MAGISAKVFRPKPLNRAGMTKALKGSAEKAAKDMAKDMTVITKGWSDGGLKFVGKVQSGRRERWEITALPANPNSKRADIFMFLDEGTGLWGPKMQNILSNPRKKAVSYALPVDIRRVQSRTDLVQRQALHLAIQFTGTRLCTPVLSQETGQSCVLKSGKKSCQNICKME